MKNDCRSQLEAAIAPLDLDTLARQTGFRRRKPKKLGPLTFIRSCCLLLVERKVSLRRWAILIGVLTNQTYAKQSLAGRMTDRAVRFVQSVVLKLVGQLSLGLQWVLPPVLAAFKRILIHDSTILTLPPFGTRFYRCSHPNAEALGYCQRSLRDNRWLAAPIEFPEGMGLTARAGRRG